MHLQCQLPFLGQEEWSYIVMIVIIIMLILVLLAFFCAPHPASTLELLEMQDKMNLSLIESRRLADVLRYLIRKQYENISDTQLKKRNPLQHHSKSDRSFFA